MTKKKQLSLQDQTSEFLLYTAPNGEVKVEVLLNGETIWLTQERIAELFGVQRPAISKHLKNIFESGELQEELVISILEHTTAHGAMADKTQTKPVRYYNLDAVISVGYRVNSTQATQFRIWATQLIKDYIIKGFAMCDEYQAAEQKAHIEYEQFNKQQKIESDFDREVKQLLSNKKRT